MEDTNDSHLARLDAAIRACMDHRADPQESDEQFLDRHPTLRDLLEPLLQRGAPDEHGDEEKEGHEHQDHDTARWLGDYRIVREIGRGGMGVVYEAEQTSLSRRVALKVLPAHLTLSPEQIERFRREAASAAKLRHPGIVPIFEVGEEDGTHFIAMEYLGGGTLADQVRAEREPRKVAELIASVAEALQHAHDHGIIHRDIKPQNILLSDDGRPMIADFGLAKDLDRDSLTMPGGLAGTPHYMSPEQVSSPSAALDHRTDVFALGVVTYEMLVGECPFEGETSQEILAQLTSREPRAVRSHDARISRDLEVICHKALEKDVGDRFQSAGEMAAELRRFLRGEAILSSRPNWTTRAVKLVRRRKLATTTVSLALLVLVGAPVGYSIHATRQRERVTQAIAAVDQVVDLIRETGLAQEPGKEKLYLEQMAKVAATCQALLTHAPSDPGLRNRMARATSRLGEFYGQVQKLDLAKTTYDQAIAISTRLTEDYPHREDFAMNHASDLHNRALVLYGMRLLPESREGFLAGLEAWETIAARKDSPIADTARLNVAIGHCNLGLTLTQLAEPAAAGVALQRALATWESLPEARKREDNARLQLARIHNNHGRLLSETGQPKSALQAFERARDESQNLLGASAGHLAYSIQNAESWVGIGRCRRDLGETEFALEAFETAENRFAKLAADFPLAPTHRHHVARTQHHRATLYIVTKQPEKARPILELASKEMKRLVEENPGNEGHLLQQAAVLNAAALCDQELKKNREDVAAQYRHVLALLEDMPHKGRRAYRVWRERGSVLSHLGSLELESGRAREARELGRRAVVEQERALEVLPGNPRSSAYVIKHHRLVILASIKLKDHAAMMDAARASLKHSGDDTQHLGFCAAVAGLAIGIVRGDPRQPPATRSEREVEYGDDAVTWLRRAVSLGFAHASKIARGREFAVLRHRADFQRLVADIAKRAKSGKR